MAGEDQAPVAGRVDPARVQVAGVGVGDVVAVPLGPADEVVGVTDVERKAGARVGAVEGDGDRRVLLPQQPALFVPGVVEAGAGHTVLGVEVVRLPGDVREHQQQIGRVVVADRERNVGTVAVDRGEHGDIRADRPVRGDLQPPGLPPVVAGDRAVGGQGGGLDDAGEPRARGDLGGSVAPVVADPVDVHGELLGRIHGDVEVDRLARGRGAGGDEALDLAADVVGGAGAATGGAAGQGGVGVPGHDLTRVVEVVLAPAQPGKGPLAEGIGDGMRQGTRLPTPNLLRPHGTSLPQAPGTTVVRRLSAPIPSTSHNACTPSPFVAN